MPKNVLIVGMPRSGTSMTASIFTRNNYFVADDKNNDLRAGDEANPSGYWEAKPLIQSNTEIFSKVGFMYDNTWLFEPISEKQRLEILTVKPNPKHKELVEKFNQHSPWMWKDPRLCYTLGYWWPLLDPDTTRVLLLKRDKTEIYQSFLKLKWRSNSHNSKTDVFNRIHDHLKAAETAIKQCNIPYIEINYSDYKKSPEQTALKLNDFFGLDITADDLGYNHKLNNRSLHGRISKFAGKLSELIPDNLRKKIIKLIPMFILKILKPGRYS